MYFAVGAGNEFLQTLLVDFPQVGLEGVQDLQYLKLLQHRDVSAFCDIALEVDQQHEPFVIFGHLLGVQVAATGLQNIANRVDDSDLVAPYLEQVVDDCEQFWPLQEFVVVEFGEELTP